MTSFMDVDSNLFDYEAIKETRSKNTRKRRSNKQKAEAQFDVSAAPVSLQHFFHDVMDITVDEPDLTVPLTGTENQAPMTYEPNFYPSNCDELAPQILDTANNFLEFAEKIENDVLPDPVTNEVETITQQVAEIQVAKLMTDLKPVDRTLRMKVKRLTAKRLAFKSLQMFSFNDIYDKHFSMDKLKLRSVNTDMLIDVSDESVEWLNCLGTKYQTMYLKQSGIEYSSDQQIMETLDPSDSHFRALGFSTILKNVDLNLLNQRNIYLDKHFEALKHTGYKEFTLDFILNYFGIKIFGIDANDYQLNYLHLIPYYLQSNKKKKIFSLFADLDLKKDLFNK
jgi:hypothetical protein